jgi:uncharacterized membrane protein
MLTFIQWLHVASAVVGVGGMAFVLIVLLPATRVLGAEQRDTLMSAVGGRFRWVSWTVILLLLVSGLTNVKLRAWEVPWGPYWRLLATKIALAFVVFAIVLALTLPLRALESFRARRRGWLSVAFGLALVVILISAYLRG